MFPIIPANSATAASGDQEGIFGFGQSPATGITNLVSNAGVVASDVAGVGTARSVLAACSYGEDKGIFGFGNSDASNESLTNLVSNAGVVASDTTGVGTVRYGLGACGYGEDKGIFGFGYTSDVGYKSLTNLVSNVGVVSSDVAGVGTARYFLGSCSYGEDKGIFGFGQPGPTNITNKVSNTGVVAGNTAGVGTSRRAVKACGYGEDKGIFKGGISDVFPYPLYEMTNLVSNTGVVASDVTGTGTGRYGMGACVYGGDKGIFGFGNTTMAAGGVSNITNLVSNTGVVASDQAATTGTARYYLSACTFN